MRDAAPSGAARAASAGTSDAVHRVADALARRGLSAPAIVLLELLRPMGFLCGQALCVMEPILSPMTGGAHRRLARFLEDGDSIERLLSALEER